MILPTAAEEARFWALLENAWAGLGPGPNEVRRAMADPDASFETFEQMAPAVDSVPLVLRALAEASAGLSREELIALDRVAERKLYEIDRADVHEVTEGSDDGFLYARGFTLVMGREFYEAVARDPEMAVPDAGAEMFCYFFARLHKERFGDYPETGSGICRESFSNTAGWPDEEVPSEP